MRNEEAAELENGNGADDALFLGHHGKDAHIVLVDEFEGLGAGGGLADGDDVADHDVTHARGDVAQVDGQGLVKPGEDRVDAGVGIAAAGGSVTGLALGVLERGVGNGGADGVGIRVFVADDVGGGDGGDGAHLTMMQLGQSGEMSSI